MAICHWGSMKAASAGGASRQRGGSDFMGAAEHAASGPGLQRQNHGQRNDGEMHLALRDRELAA